MKRKASTARSDLEQMLVDETAEPKALPLSLLEDITGDFSEDQEIGSGGFAVVYKGILCYRAVAVKRMSKAYMHETEFHREVECLMRVRHKNVVRFLGYCADTQGSMERYNGKLVMADVRQRLLCFEYIPKGSLDKYIIDAYREWGTCYKIIKGICEGLQYLHDNHIIHLDLKPANILLDDNMVPKITDFGLSRCYDENQSRAITKTILGTMGYLAPEFCEGGVISRSADLYSLGVIIIEILTGHKGYQAIEDVLESWSDRLERSQRDTLCEQIRVCYETTLECRDFNPKKRPASARDIIYRLHEMKNIQEQNKRSNPNQYADENCRSEANPEVENQEHTAAADELRFLGSLKTPVYTKRKLTAEDDKAIEIAIFRDNQIITSGPLSSARIEIVALHGDFLYVVPYNWTERDFTGRIVSNQQGPTLGGVCQVKLNNGVASLSDICFKKVSSKTDSGKLILAARVHRSDNGGRRVKEAVMDAVQVQVLSNQVNEKSNRPKLKDEVYRLNGITRNGQPLKKLQERGIYYVEDFLRAIYKDKENIRNRCFNIWNENKRWEATVKHAKECDLEGNHMLKLYRADEENVELFFNCIHDLVGAKFNGCYIPNDNFTSTQQAKVNQLKIRAYDELAGIEFSYEMKEDGPMPLSTTANIVIAGEASVPLTGIAETHPQGTGGIISVPGASEPILPEPHGANGYEGIGSTIYVPSVSEPILLEPHNTNGYEGNTGIGTTIYGRNASEPILLELHSTNGYEGNPAREQMVHEQVVVADVGGQLSDILPPEEAYGGDHCLGGTQNTWDIANVDGSFPELTDFELENHGLSGMSWQWQDSNYFLSDNSMEASTSTQTNLMPGHPLH